VLKYCSGAFFLVFSFSSFLVVCLCAFVLPLGYGVVAKAGCN
jgi:hypothetical protein